MAGLRSAGSLARGGGAEYNPCGSEGRSVANEWAAFRNEFPALRDWAYFGWASVAPLSLRSSAAMERQIAGVREHGALVYREWYAAYERARHLAAELTGSLATEIALLKNTSEGVSTVAFGLDWKSGDNVLIPGGEFPANFYPWQALAARGVELRTIPVDANGAFAPADAEKLMDARTRVLALSFVNYATGFRADLEALGKLCRARGIFFFVDAIQGLGALPFDARAMNVDAWAADGHKWICGPEGQAMLCVRTEWLERIAPLARGWWCLKEPGQYAAQDQELCRTARRFECGTLNSIGVYGLCGALELLRDAGIERVGERALHLAGRLESGLRARGMRVYRAPFESGQSGIVSFEAPGHDTRRVAEELERRKIFVNPRGGRLRAAVHAWNDETDLARLLEALPRV